MTQLFNKRIFTLKEHINIMSRAAKSINVLFYAKRNKLFNKKFKERIMLAVTEVNGCQLCSYVHTKVALSSGMNKEEIKQILNGSKDDIPESELLAILFAQHYADSHESPDKSAVSSLVAEYGKDKAKIICAILSFITLTTSMGISMGLFKDRLKFKRVKGSKLINEISIPLLSITVFPVLVVYYKIKSLFKVSQCDLIPSNT